MIAKSQIEVVGKPTFCDEYSIPKGPFLYYVRVGGQENGNFPLLYAEKMSLRKVIKYLQLQILQF